MNGLERINSGTLMVTGYDLADKHTDLNKIRKNVGMVFQHFNLYDNHTVLENITLAPKIVLHRPEKENHDIAMDLLKKWVLKKRPICIQDSYLVGKSNVLQLLVH